MTAVGERPAAGQTWAPEGYIRHAGFVADLGAPLLDLAGPGEARAALDVGCGDGRLSQDLARRGWRVTAVDADPAMVAAASARGLDAHLGNARAPDSLPPGPVALIFSNAAMHWMGPLAPVIARLAPRLAPGGRLVVEMGGHGNVAAIRTGLHALLRAVGVDPLAHDPWTFPTVADAEAALAAAGLIADDVALIPRPTPLPTGIEGWLETFASPLLGTLPAAQQGPALDQLVGLLRPMLCDGDGQWTADYVRLRFTAHRPS